MAKKLRGLELLEYIRSGEVVMELSRGDSHVIFRNTSYKDKTPEEILERCRGLGNTARKTIENTYRGKSYEEGKEIWEASIRKMREAEERCGPVVWIKGEPDSTEEIKYI